MENKLYINGVLQEGGKYLEALIDIIIKNNFKEGETFDLKPFNYFDDEKTDYKAEVEARHTNLTISKIEIILLEFWNSTIKTIRNIYLVESNKTFDSLSAEEQEPYLEKAAEMLNGLHCCTRVWEAWWVGTMTESDFILADEAEDLVYERAEMLFNFKNNI